MIYVAKVELPDEQRSVTLASLDGANYFSINWDPRPEDEEDIKSLLTPKSEGEAPYRGFPKKLLVDYNAVFNTVG